MKTELWVPIAALLLLLGSPDAESRPATSAASQAPRPEVERSGSASLLQSSSSSLSLAKAPTDTFYLYGGPGTEEGKFQNGALPDRQGWIGVDLTDIPVFWQTSTFNAENLGGIGAGNHAAWSGQTAAQQPGWSNAPGYGNGWNDILIFESGAVSNTAASQTVTLDFDFNYDTEPGYDFFNVEYDSAGTWVSIFAGTGSSADTNGVFQAPGLSFAASQVAPIFYAGGDYGGANSDEVVVRVRISSDGAWSDEDGLWPTSGGAGQVDNIHITWSDGSDTETFESGFTGMWTPEKSPFAGDFSRVWPSFTDLDPCREDRTPLMAFVDAGQEVGNAASAAQIPGYPTSTGGQTSPNWTYGVSGGWVVNYNGGLSFGQLPLSNEVWSPEIDWDLPGSQDDGPDVVGVSLRYSHWDHLPFGNGMTAVWHVRSQSADGTWGLWRDRNTLYWTGVPGWYRSERIVSDLIEPNPRAVQISLGVVDLASQFGFPGADATPSPAFDDVALVKYQIEGPQLSTRSIDIANDGFPVAGGIDASSQVARDALDIPFNMSRSNNLAADPNNTPGDSIIVDIKAVIPGTALTDMRMVWVLDKNPLFEDAIRVAPARAKDQNVVTGATQWSGEVVHDSSRTNAGALIEDRYFFDLPDQNLIYPGDVLRYYIQASDNGARTTTLPNDTTGFLSGVGYSRTFTVRGLPSISDASGTQPTKLVYNDFGRRGGENEWLNALGQLGFVEGTDYDSYTTQGPSSGVSNSIGSAGAHGANAGQLTGYDTIVYFTGDLSSFIMSDGSDQGNNDKANDLQVLTDWHALAGARNMVYFGDNVVSALAAESAAGATYASTVMGVSLTDNDVRDEIEGQKTPTVQSLATQFQTPFVAWGGCPAINRFDSIRALPPAFRGHGFLDLAGTTYPSIAASVVHDRIEGGSRKVDVTFPYGLSSVYDPMHKTGVAAPARAELFRELFEFFGGPGSGNTPVSAPGLAPVSMRVFPTPFNPTTSIRFENLPAATVGSVRIFNLRGERVRTLHSGEFRQSDFQWFGRDDAGHSVASGIYLIEAVAGEFRQVQKVALLR